MMPTQIETFPPLIPIVHRRSEERAGGSELLGDTNNGRATGREEGLDNTLAETFPCSDPLSSIPNPLS
jgi:hypothetical protein